VNDQLAPYHDSGLDLLGLVAKGRTLPKPELEIWFTDILGNKYVQIIHLGMQGITPDVV
jgi:hypothetical protein